MDILLYFVVLLASLKVLTANLNEINEWVLVDLLSVICVIL